MTGRTALPELLAPAGSPAALDAAIEGGADAVYFGGSAFNARMLAQNFGGDAMGEAAARCHAYGVKAYVTLNTLVSDREQDACLRAAEEAYRAGVDALIVADLGVAATLRRHIPELALHASTQASGHNAEAAKALAELGFTRMVCARELSRADLADLVRESPIEIEMFIHGALCVSHSGQCLFSSLVGGRSGNRGECAQPCRLPYPVGGKQSYPLSLKDLTLAPHVPALIDLGVASLKIEGRMKSPEYVRDVVSIWRRLLNERRGADAAELRQLADIFSRGGFTDAYFRGLVGTQNVPSRQMLGVRSEADKTASRQLEPFRAITRTAPISLSAEIRSGRPIALTATAGEHTVTVTGDVPEPARTAPLDRDAVLRCLGKLGGTPYRAEEISLALDEGLMVPVSRLNALRRDAISALMAKTHTPHSEFSAGKYQPCPIPAPDAREARIARFASIAQITPAARDFFDVIYLPLEVYREGAPALCPDGVILPPVILPRERDAVRELLARAKAQGVSRALVGNLGHIDLARDAGLDVHGDFRFNVTSAETLTALAGLGVEDCLLSPELTLPQLRDLPTAHRAGKAAVVYGRVPLMLLEKCAIREVADCAACAAGRATLTDRRGVRFPMLRAWDHRTVVLNSRPTYMLDRLPQVRSAGVTVHHYLFTVENAAEVDEIITAARVGKAPRGDVRRI
ncbi:MAG: U32 family peptidase [Ruminococcaceae bacterium]|nr:U32 family peptidase [Oscillospiraceae bacterium]